MHGIVLPMPCARLPRHHPSAARRAQRHPARPPAPTSAPAAAPGSPQRRVVRPAVGVEHGAIKLLVRQVEPGGGLVVEVDQRATEDD